MENNNHYVKIIMKKDGEKQAKRLALDREIHINCMGDKKDRMTDRQKKERER